MKKTLILLVTCMMSFLLASAQGCIPLRNISGFGQYNFTDHSFSTSDWQLNLTNRYFRSFRDFRGDKDLKTPAQNESVNTVYTMEISVDKMLAHGWSMNLSLPVTDNARTSSLEHGGPNTPRYTTRSFGAGDLSFTVYKWLLRSEPNQKFNVQLGLGIKLPTGDYRRQDFFHINDSTRVLSGINPGIQLGDGGTGIITELNFFYQFSNTVSLYGNFYYLISPVEMNGATYTTGKTPSALQMKTGQIYTSVPDVFSIRAGVLITKGNFSFSAGIRDEGSPVYDLVGGSEGLRRAGHYFSVEPGILYKFTKLSVYGYVPIVVDRRINQNVADKEMSAATGTYTVGPGGSANMMFIAGISFRL